MRSALEEWFYQELLNADDETIFEILMILWKRGIITEEQTKFDPRNRVRWPIEESAKPEEPHEKMSRLGWRVEK